MAEKPTLDQLPDATASPDDINRIAQQWGEIPKNQLPTSAEDHQPAPAAPQDIAVNPNAPEPVKPTEAPVEKPADEPAGDDEPWPRTAKDWQQLKRKNSAKIAEKESALKQAMAELTELKSKAVDLTQLDEIKKQRDELDEKLKLVAFERHPNFKVYDTKIAKVIEESKTLVGKDAQDSLVKTLAMPDGEAKRAELAKITEGLDDYSKAELVAAVREIRRLNNERESEHAKHKDNLQKWQHDEEEKVKVRRAEILQAFDRTLGKLKKSPEHMLLQPGDNADLAKVAEEIEKNARYYFGGEDIKPDHAAELAVEAASAPFLRRQTIGLAKRIAELEDTIAKLKPATRTTTSVQPAASAPTGDSRGDSDDQMLARIKAAWA